MDILVFAYCDIKTEEMINESLVYSDSLPVASLKTSYLICYPLSEQNNTSDALKRKIDQHCDYYLSNSELIIIATDTNTINANSLKIILANSKSELEKKSQKKIILHFLVDNDYCRHLIETLITEFICENAQCNKWFERLNFVIKAKNMAPLKKDDSPSSTTLPLIMSPMYAGVTDVQANSPASSIALPTIAKKMN